MFLDPTPAENEEYRRRAAVALKAAEVLITFRRLSLNRRVRELTMRIASAGREGIDTGPLVDEHLEHSQQKFNLETKAGQEKFKMDLLEELFAKEMNEPRY
jgi:hypothetical protein